MSHIRMTEAEFEARQARLAKGGILSSLKAPEAVKRAKFNNVKVDVDGERFDSKREAARYAELVLMEKAGSIRNLRVKITYTLIDRQPPYDDQPSLPAMTYTPDFSYDEPYKAGWRPVTEDVKFTAGASPKALKRLKQTTAYQLFRVKVKLMRQVLGLIVKEV